MQARFFASAMDKHFVEKKQKILAFPRAKKAVHFIFALLRKAQNTFVLLYSEMSTITYRLLKSYILK